MKSYFLEGTMSREVVATALSELLPGQTHPWLLMTGSDDPVAYLHVDAQGNVQADLSGRNVHQAPVLSALLADLQQRVGGTVTVDD